MKVNSTTVIEQRQKKYSEKLKDPRWQRMRLEILNRDDFTCQICYDKESTLHVHHKLYKRGAEPWEYEPDLLVTLCEDCHEEEELELKEYEYLLIQELRRIFYADNLRELAGGFSCLKPHLNHFSSHHLATAIANALHDQAINNALTDRYLYTNNKQSEYYKAEEAVCAPVT